MTILIKPIGEMHLNAVKTIEKTCFPKPWDDRIFRMLARWKGRILLERGKIVQMIVAEENKETVGYIVWEENRVSLRG